MPEQDQASKAQSRWGKNDMNDAPEKIWAMASIDAKWSDAHATNHQPYVNDITAPFIFEYTRSDVAQARIAELEAALTWYGEQARLARLIHSEGDEGRHAIDMDGGKRALAALEAKP
jgi:hypothetical protein